VMSRERIDARSALERLRRVSQNRNVKLRDLCQDLVDRVGGAAGSGGRQ
ncbi:ANTAR domain-containing protein, partial [Streptomyces sp. TRM76130]|nr:ANTAR domain-containing protein [Streptomyces sp. TRM76130]